MPKKAVRNEIRHPYIVEVAIVGDELNISIEQADYTLSSIAKHSAAIRTNIHYKPG
jgi:hypothetical protein